MSTREDFWKRVQAALDARENPLQDAWIEEALVAHPEWLADLLALTERLAELPAPEPAGARAGSPALARLAVAAGLLLALGLFAAPPERSPEISPAAAAPEAPAGRILDWSITVRHTRPNARSFVHNVNGHLSTEESSVEQAPPLPGATAVASMRLARSAPPSPPSR